MYREVVILVKEKEKDTAVERVEDFLAPGYYSEWDFYEVLEAVPLTERLKEVKKMCCDTDVAAELYFDRMLMAKEEERRGDPGYYSAYCAGRYHLLKSKLFCFESNVFDLENNETEQVPEDINGYWAVLVELHS